MQKTTKPWPICLLLGLLTGLPTAALAQPGASDAATSAKPVWRYQNLRFEEQPALWQNQTLEGLTQLKYLPLNTEAPVWLSLGGSWRVRGEGWLGFNLDPTQNDAFGLNQLRAHADLNLGPHVRLFGELISALSSPRSLPGGIRTIDMDAADLQNLFVDLRWPGTADQPPLALLRLGRQEMDFGKERLVSSLRWVNSRRSFDAARAIGQWQGLQLDGFYAQLVQVDKQWLNTSSPAHSLYGLYGSAPLNPWLSVPGQAELYWLGLHRQQASFGGITGREDRQTLGGRLALPLPLDFSLELEGAAQLGRFDTQAIVAGFGASELAWQSPWPLQPRFSLGLDYASGDHSPHDQQLNTFNQLMPLAHAYYGIADIFGRQNAMDLHAGVQLQLLPALSASLRGHAFWQASLQDSHYQVNGTAWPIGLLPGERQDPWSGLELDLLLNYRFSPAFQLELGLSHFVPGSGLAGTAAPLSFGYLQGLWQF